MLLTASAPNLERFSFKQTDDKVNIPLSVRRAEACKKYLVSKGISAERMTTAGFGSTQPVADNKTAEGRQKNRRIEIKIKG